MGNFDYNFLRRCAYYLLERKIILSENNIVFENDILVQFLQFLYEEVEQAAKRILSIEDEETFESLEINDYEEQLEIESYDLYGAVVQDAIVYELLFPTKENEKFMNYILKSDIEDIISLLQEVNDLSLFMINNFFKYLVKRNTKKLSDEQVDDIYKKNPWLDELYSHKGYSTINEKARRILIQMDEQLMSIGTDTVDRELYFDNYFTNLDTNEFIIAEFSETMSKSEILYLKSLQFRLMIADAYISLKSWALEEKDGEYLDEDPFYRDARILLETIENAFEVGHTISLSQTGLVHQIYSTFFAYNTCNCLRSDHLELLDREEETKTLKLINPLYYMDSNL